MLTVLLLALTGMVTLPAGHTLAAPVPETEPNDDFGNGTWMTLGTSYYGDVGYMHGGNPDPADYFRFNVSKNQDFSLTVNVSYSVEGVRARVYDPGQQLVNSSLLMMNGGRWDFSNNSGNSDGIWYLEVRGTPSNFTIDTWTAGSVVDPFPKVSISSPLNNSVVGSLLVQVTGTASDDISVASVYAYPEGAIPMCWTKATGTTSWSVTLNMSEFVHQSGGLRLWAIATDSEGNQNYTNITVFYYKSNPTVVITSPLNNSVAASLLVQVRGTSSDDKSVARVDVYPEDALPACWTKATGTISWNATVNITAYASHGGRIKLWAHVEDGDGNMNLTYIVVLYNNFSPRITINFPETDEIVLGPEVSVAGRAYDDVFVAKVDAYPEGTPPAFWSHAMVYKDQWATHVNISEAAAHGGSVRIWVMATDSDGNTNNTSVTVHYQGFSPIIIIKSPMNNSNVTDTLVRLTGNASDDGSVEKVDMAPEGVGPAFWTRAEGTTNWTATVNISGHIGQDGHVTIWAYVTDNDGNLNSTSITVFYNTSPPMDVTPPVIYITSPTEGQAFTVPNITVEGVADDNVGVSWVKLRLYGMDWQNVTIVPGAGTRLHWNLSLKLQDGPWIIAVMAMDRAENFGFAYVNVTVNNPELDREKPVLEVTYPPDRYEHYGATIVIRGTARDNVGVEKVEAMESLRQTPWQMASGNDSWHNWSIDFPLVIGPNIVQLCATDTNGNTATVVLSINRTEHPVDEATPEVEIRDPQTGAKWYPDSVVVSGMARDDIALEKIELWVNGKIMATKPIDDNATSANWSFRVWLKDGINKINVTAKDMADKQASAEITVDHPVTYNKPFPGFEATVLFAVLAVAAVLLARKKNA
jgi:hypothetical protein